MVTICVKEKNMTAKCKNIYDVTKDIIGLALCIGTLLFPV